MRILRKLVRKPFRGYHFYEWQIGPLVLQMRHSGGDPVAFRRFHAWLDPHWRQW